MTEALPHDAASDLAPHAQGVRAELRALYRAHARDVWHTLRRLGVPNRDLEDAMHEVYLVAWRRLDGFDRSRPARPWLCGIAWRVAAAWRRKASARNESLGLPDQVRDAQDDATTALERAAAVRAVHAALATLPEAQRDVFVLHELDGLSMPEISTLVDAPLNTLYSRLRLARARFADELRLREEELR